MKYYQNFKHIYSNGDEPQILHADEKLSNK